MRTTITLAICLSFSALAYAKKFPLIATPTVPGATGLATSGNDKNGNTKVKIKVEHLAAPENLTPPKNGYVIWFRQRDGAPEAQGRLKIAKNLKGAFETSTSWKTFEIMITAEDDSAAKSPMGPEVLKTTVQQ